MRHVFKHIEKKVEHEMLLCNYGFHSTAVQASSQSDLPLASVYAQVKLLTLLLKGKNTW